MVDDPANTRSRARSTRGYHREVAQRRTTHHPNPARGGTRGYPLWQRYRVLDTLTIYQDYQFAADRIGCSHSSVRRWEQRARPYRMAGGTPRHNLCGMDQMLLATILYIYPDAQADQICAFIIANGGATYTRQDITKRCAELRLTRKKSSHEAYRANTPTNIAKALWFVSLPPPLGVFNIRLDRLIDVDETGFYLSNVKTKYGRGHTTCRIRYPSHYTRSEPRINVIMAIEAGSQTVAPFVDGSIMFPRRWLFISQNNCDQYMFGDFINSILSSIENAPAPGDVDDERCILWDNLSLHKTPYVTNKIFGRPTNNRFISVDRPPYRPTMAPIEFIFCELAAELSRRVQEDWTVDDLRQNIFNICSTIGRNGKFENTFVHCNYPYN